MRAKRTASADELGLGSPINAATPDEDVANAVGDPAYLHEIAGRMGGWSRKQLEKAINRLIWAGTIASYGMGTRRLYASARTVDQTLACMPAAHVRLLQYMPLGGGVRHATITALMAETSPMVDALEEAGLIMRLHGAAKGHQMLMLTAHGRRARRTLGNGLALQPLTMAEVEGETDWWAFLRRLAVDGPVAEAGNAHIGEKLIRFGYARNVARQYRITRAGRRAWDGRGDLLDMTRMIDAGMPPHDAHRGLAALRITTGSKGKDMAKRMKTADAPADEPADASIATEAASAGTAKAAAIASMPATAPRNNERLHAYLLMRTDMPSLGAVKSRIQAMHAGNAMTHELYVGPLKARREPHPDVAAWHDQGAGFGTAVAIGARGELTLEILQAAVAEAGRLGIMAGLVVDGEYPYVVSDEIHRRLDPSVHTRPAERTAKGWRCFCRETTAGWMLGDAAALELLLSRFNLAPHAADERF